MGEKLIRLYYDDFHRFRKTNIMLIESIGESSLNIIPKGFRNNIFWQAGHLVTVEASLLYLRTNQTSPLDECYFRYFGKGPSPADFDDGIPVFSEIRKWLDKLPLIVESDLEKMKDLTYSEPRTVTSGKVLESFQDALQFLSLHEAYHLGSITAMAKLL